MCAIVHSSNKKAYTKHTSPITITIPIHIHKKVTHPYFTNFCQGFNMDTKFNSKASGLLQSEELYQYILRTSVYPRESEPLREIRKTTETHPKSVMAASPLAGQLLSFILKLVNPKKTIEVGVFTGYSLLLTALSIPDDGKIIAIDVDRKAYEIGLPFIRQAGVEHKIDFIESDATLVLDNLLKAQENEGSFEFAFVDADKCNYLKYHEKLMKLVKVGGVLAYDNTLWGGTVAMPESELPEEPKYLKAYHQDVIKVNNFLANDPRIEIAHLPLGDGITLCKRLF